MTVKGHFDGRVIVLDEPLDLPRNESLVIHIERGEPAVLTSAPHTARAVLSSGLVGLWKDRDEIEDSAAYARQIRQQAQSRPRQ